MRSGSRIALVSVYDQGTHGHRSLSAVLKVAGHDVHNLFFGDRIIQDAPTVTDAEVAAFASLIRGIEPDWVGFSVTSLLSHPAAAMLARAVKQWRDVPVVFGGPYPSLLPAVVVERAPVDYVCIGEGEETIVELAGALARGVDADDVPGIFGARRRAYVPREPPADLDALPFPDVDDDPRKFQISSDGGAIVPGDPFFRRGDYHTKCSRNCPFRCSFCSAPNMRQLASATASVALRRRSPARIIAEIQHARALNPRVCNVGFWDDTFPAEPTWVRELAAAYKEHVGLPFYIWAHPKTVRERNVAALATAGLKGAILGIESAAAETRRDVFLRPETDDDIVAADAILHRHGVERSYDLILDHPWESPTELESSFTLLSRLQRPFKVGMHSLVLFPETKLAERALREGLFRDPQQIVDGILADVDDTRHRFQWVRRVPRQRDALRAYWVFLILCLGHPRIPPWLPARLVRSRLLRRHPELLTGLDPVDMRHTDDGFADGVMAALRRTGLVGALLRRLPAADRRIETALRRSTAAALAAYVAQRVVTGLPRAMLRPAVERGRP